jgi:hypothetical protein
MFRPSRGSDQSRIRLPKQSVAPGVRELQSIYEQARENRGREVELVWQVPGTYKSYSIHIKFDRVTPHPVWNIWENNGRESKMIWRFETSDVHMIYDVVAMLEVAHQRTDTLVNPTGSSSGTAFPAVGSQFGSQSGTFSTTSNVPFATQSQAHLQAQPQLQSPNTMPARPGTAEGWRNVDQMQGQVQQQSPAPFPSPNSNPTGQFPVGSGSGFPVPGNGTAPSAPQPGFNPQATGGFNPRRTGSFPAPTIAQAINQAQNAPAQTQLPTQPQFQQQPRAGFAPAANTQMPEGSLPADFFSDAPATIAAAAPSKKSTTMEGIIEQNPMNNVLTEIGMQQLTGKLEVIGSAAVGHVYFENGIPKDAQTSSTRGDESIKDLVTWRSGTYIFKPGLKTEMHSVEKSLQTSVQEGIALLDQLKHLEKAGLVYESLLTQKQKNLGEPEIKLMLAKGVPLDFNLQKDVYDSLKNKTTFTDLLRDRPMEQTQWAPLLFNLLYCGLIEIKPPSSTRGGALDFLGEGKHAVQNLALHFMRSDTGIMSWEGLLYFLEHEYYRWEAYGWPVSLVVFEMSVRRTGSSGIIERDPLSPEALAAASTRIGLVKRPLDLLTHFHGNEYAILMPNTKASQAAFVSNRILDALTVTPLAPGIDKGNLAISFGVANLPADGEDLQTLIESAAGAQSEAREGSFPLVLARSSKRD